MVQRNTDHESFVFTGIIWKHPCSWTSLEEDHANLIHEKCLPLHGHIKLNLESVIVVVESKLQSIILKDISNLFLNTQCKHKLWSSYWDTTAKPKTADIHKGIKHVSKVILITDDRNQGFLFHIYLSLSTLHFLDSS